MQSTGMGHIILVSRQQQLWWQVAIGS